MSKPKVKNILSIDWTSSRGLKPFYISDTNEYAIAIETEKDYDQLSNSQSSSEIIRLGLQKILESENKFSEENLNSIFNSGFVPSGAEGIFVPLKPDGFIKVLVKIGASEIDNLDEIPYILPQAFDVFTFNTYRMSQKLNKTSNMLNDFDAQTKKFVGKVYNVKLDREAQRVQKFSDLLRSLAQSNGQTIKESSSREFRIGVSGSGPESKDFLPMYVQYQTDNGYVDLTKKFNDFRDSSDLSSNSLFIIKNIDEITKEFPKPDEAKRTIFNNTSSVSPIDSNSVGWEYFVKKYINFPSAIITRDEGRRLSPPLTIRAKIAEEIEDLAQQNPVKTSDALELEELRRNSREVRDEIQKKAAEASDFVGTHAVDNLGLVLNEVRDIRSLYFNFLSKYGLTGVAEAALRCAKINIPFDEIVAFIALAKSTFEDIVQILKIPVISLDDLIPTVDIMFDIIEGVIISITQAVFDALWNMVEQILVTLLENCGDISKAQIGGLPLDQYFSSGKFADILGENLKSASLVGLQQGLLNPPFTTLETQKFIQNLNTFIQPGATQNLLEGGSQALTDALSIISNNLTPSETMQAFRGNPTPETIRIVKRIARSLNSGQDAPQGSEVVEQILDTDEKVQDFFFVLSKFLSENQITSAIDELQETFPKFSGFLCDVDDRNLRGKLLSDKGLSPQEVNDQINASRDRSKRTIEDLSKFLENFDLNDYIPPQFDNGEEEGLFNLNHPSFLFMRDQTFTTMFRGVENAFRQDTVQFPSLMKINTIKNEDIPRVIRGSGPGSVTIGNETYILNPKFMDLVRNSSPNSFRPPFKQYTSLEETGRKEQDTPTPAGAVRALEETIKVAKDADDRARRGESGYEIVNRSIPATTFAPGLSSENYGKYITDFSDPSTYIIGKKLLKVDKKITEINIKSSLEAQGITQILNSQIAGSIPAGSLNLITTALNNEKVISLQNSNLPVDENGRYITGSDDYLKDKIFVSIRTDSMIPTLRKADYQKNHSIDLPVKTLKVFKDRIDRDLVPIPDNSAGTGTFHSARDIRFVKFLIDIVKNGEKIYNLDGQTMVEQMRPSLRTTQSLLSLLIDQNPDGSSPKLNSLYEEIWRDLIAEFFAEVGRDNGLLEKSYDLLNLSPLPTIECPDPTLLRLKHIKRQVDEIYKQLYKRGLEFNLPTVSGLDDTRDNSLEQSFIYGIVRTIVRVYVIENLLKGLITFNKLYYDNVDEVFVGFIEDKIINGVKSSGYFPQFQAEVIKSHRNRYSGLSSFSEAIRDFIRKEIRCMGQAFLYILGKDNADLIKSGELLKRIIPEYDVSLLAKPRFFREPVLFHDRYRTNKKGFEDWRNGGFYFEKYVRIKVKQEIRSSLGSHLRDIPNGVHRVSDFNTKVRTLFNNQSFISGLSTVNVPPVRVRKPKPNPDCLPGDPNYVEIDIPQPDLRSNIKYNQVFEYIRFGYRLVCDISRTSEGDSQVFNSPGVQAFIDQIENSPGRNIADINKSYFFEAFISTGVTNNTTKTLAFPITCIENQFNLDILLYNANSGNVTITDFVGEYNSVATSMKNAITNTDEWSFMFDYCFPKDRAVSLVALQNIISVEGFGNIDKAFNNTKLQLRLAFLSALNSGNYQFNSGLEDSYYANIAQGKIPDIDFGKMALSFILGMMKAAGENFSPAVSIGKKIQTLAKATQGLLATATAGLSFGQIDDENNPFVQKDKAGNIPEGLDVCSEIENDTDLGKEIQKFLSLDRVEPFILGLLPIDLFLLAPGPPLTPLGFFYLAYEPLMNEIFKDKETKDLERCNTGFSNEPCPPPLDCD